MVKTPGNGRLNNLNDTVLNVLNARVALRRTMYQNTFHQQGAYKFKNVWAYFVGAARKLYT